MKNLKFGIFCLMTLFTVSIFLASCGKEELETPQNTIESKIKQKYKTILDGNLSSYELIHLEVDKIYDEVKLNMSGDFTLNLGIKSKPNWKFVMQNNPIENYLTPDFKSYAVGENDKLTEMEFPEILIINGAMNQNAKKSLMTFYLGRMEALIIDGETGWKLQSLFDYDENAPSDLYVLYKENDILFEEHLVCSDEDEDLGMDIATTEPKSNTCTMINLTIFGDYQFYTKWSSNRWNNAAAYRFNRFLFGQKKYRQNNIQLNWLLKADYQHSDFHTRNARPNATDDKGKFVRQCASYYNKSWYKEGDVNYFLTGDDVYSGNDNYDLIGKAYGIGRMCFHPEKAFSFGEYQSTATKADHLIAHEVGHTMGINHDNEIKNFMHRRCGKWKDALGPTARLDILWGLNIGGGCLFSGPCIY